MKALESFSKVALVCALAWVIGQVTSSAQQRSASSGPVSAASERAVLDKYCVTCHSDKGKIGGLTLEKRDIANVSAAPDVWEKVVLKLRAGMMPPAGLPRPDKAARDALVGFLETSLDRAAELKPNPGRTETFHRLNRAEYQNSIRDLLHLDIDASELLPVDDASYGFDNIGGLRMSPVLTERYTGAARKISRLAIGDLAIAPTEQEFRVSQELRQDEHFEGMPFGTRGGTNVHFTFPVDAEYTIQVKTTGPKPPEEHQIELSLDGERLKLFRLGPPPAVAKAKGSDANKPDQIKPVQAKPDQAKAEAMSAGSVAPKAVRPQRVVDDMDAPEDASTNFVVRVPVKAGPHDVMAVFLEKSEAEPETTRRLQLRPAHNSGGTQWEPAIGSVIIGGPYKATGPGDSPSRARIFVCHPSATLSEGACAKEIFSQLIRRAYRRPSTDADLQLLLKFYDQGRTAGNFESGIEMGLRMLLASPSFLVRVERDPSNAPPGTNYRVNDLELASRLSFFLWSSIPDDQLLDLAIQGKLSDPAVMEQQVKRMLADQRSGALVKNFTAQWLYLRNLESILPDAELFPDFDDNLRQAFQTETEMFFDNIMHNDSSVLDLISANYTFVNDRLAKHYGIPNVAGSHFRRVTLPETRGGILGQGSVLTVTSNAIRTSPVLRGKWILENILGTPPPPPPENVPPLKENTPGNKAQSVRERLEEHRKNPACASCHKIMDPLGLSLENYDAIGAFRLLSEAGTPIDASGELLDGTHLNGAVDLKKALLSHSDDFVSTFTGKLMTYALGRGMEPYDAPAIRKIMRDSSGAGYSFSTVIIGIVKSTPFQMRRTQS
jgi:Protein of unknown function (DUF1592)/Protein of unknown function (DUF1588)/Protein of unknown function (DUF1585)/Protein of unknown function (DUF1587)/Protein of unknown function (DUF1595)/Cytochrome C oxidase, cbb3-type, subunit III